MIYTQKLYKNKKNIFNYYHLNSYKNIGSHPKITMLSKITLLLGFSLISINPISGTQNSTAETIKLGFKNDVIISDNNNSKDSFKYFLDYSSDKKKDFDKAEELARIKAEQERVRIEQEKIKKEEEEKARQLEIQRQAAEKEAKNRAIAREKEQSINSPVISNHGGGDVTSKIYFWASQYGVDGNRALRIAKCESGLNPSITSSNGLYGGVYQQAYKYWPARAASVGLAGANILDADANIKVSIMMMAKDGFYHWPRCSKK